MIKTGDRLSLFNEALAHVLSDNRFNWYHKFPQTYVLKQETIT